MTLVFVLEVAKCSAERKVAVNTGLADKMVSVVDALLLFLVVRLVVLRKLDNLRLLLHENGAAIASVCAIDVLFCNEDDAAGGAHILRPRFLFDLVIDFHEA